MPLRAHQLQSRSIAPRRPSRETTTVPFDDLVYRLAEGVADAQTKLDESTAATIETLAETTVDAVPKLTRTVGEDGSVTVDAAPAQSRSLLELGFAPVRYQFSDATVELELDISVTERGKREDGLREGERTDRSFGLQADTREVIEHRVFDREASANARVEARLEPTPLPPEARPVEGRETQRGDEHAN